MPAGHEATARAFYCGVLGLVEEQKPPNLTPRGGAWFRGGTLRLHLGVDPDFHPAGKAHPALLVSGLAALLTRCEAAGFPAARDEPLDGFDRAYVLDPFGNRIELLEPRLARNDDVIVTIADGYERIAKLTAYFVAVVYVIGVAVVNLRLAQFGISGMGLLREQYIFAGTWAILPVVAVSVAVGTLCGFGIHMRFPGDAPVESSAMQDGPSEGRETSPEHAKGPLPALRQMWTEFRRTVRKATPIVIAAGRAAWATVFWVVLAAAVLRYALNRAVPGATSAITPRDFFFTTGKIAVFTAGIGVCGAFAVDILRGTKDKWNYVLAAAVCLTTGILVLAYLSFFAVSVYARIPSAVGGGADTPVRLVLALDQATAARLGNLGDGVPTLRLLFVAGNMYYVISPADSTRAVGIPASAILGIETLH